MKDITPERFRCGPTISSCPAIYEDDDHYVIVGQMRSTDNDQLRGKVGIGEAAVRIPRKIIDEAIRARSEGESQ